MRLPNWFPFKAAEETPVPSSSADASFVHSSPLPQNQFTPINRPRKDEVNVQESNKGLLQHGPFRSPEPSATQDAGVRATSNSESHSRERFRGSPSPEVDMPIQEQGEGTKKRKRQSAAFSSPGEPGGGTGAVQDGSSIQPASSKRQRLTTATTNGSPAVKHSIRDNTGRFAPKTEAISSSQPLRDITSGSTSNRRASLNSTAERPSPSKHALRDGTGRFAPRSSSLTPTRSKSVGNDGATPKQAPLQGKREVTNDIGAHPPTSTAATRSAAQDRDSQIALGDWRPRATPRRSRSDHSDGRRPTPSTSHNVRDCYGRFIPLGADTTAYVVPPITPARDQTGRFLAGSSSSVRRSKSTSASCTHVQDATTSARRDSSLHLKQENDGSVDSNTGRNKDAARDENGRSRTGASRSRPKLKHNESTTSEASSTRHTIRDNKGHFTKKKTSPVNSRNTSPDPQHSPRGSAIPEASDTSRDAQTERPLPDIVEAASSSLFRRGLGVEAYALRWLGHESRTNDDSLSLLRALISADVGKAQSKSDLKLVSGQLEDAQQATWSKAVTNAKALATDGNKTGDDKNSTIVSVIVPKRLSGGGYKIEPLPVSNSSSLSGGGYKIEPLPVPNSSSRCAQRTKAEVAKLANDHMNREDILNSQPQRRAARDRAEAQMAAKPFASLDEVLLDDASEAQAGAGTEAGAEDPASPAPVRLGSPGARDASVQPDGQKKDERSTSGEVNSSASHRNAPPQTAPFEPRRRSKTKGSQDLESHHTAQIARPSSDSKEEIRPPSLSSSKADQDSDANADGLSASELELERLVESSLARSAMRSHAPSENRRDRKAGHVAGDDAATESSEQSPNRVSSPMPIRQREPSLELGEAARETMSVTSGHSNLTSSSGSAAGHRIGNDDSSKHFEDGTPNDDTGGSPPSAIEMASAQNRTSLNSSPESSQRMPPTFERRLQEIVIPRLPDSKYADADSVLDTYRVFTGLSNTATSQSLPDHDSPVMKSVERDNIAPQPGLVTYQASATPSEQDLQDPDDASGADDPPASASPDPRAPSPADSTESFNGYFVDYGPSAEAPAPHQQPQEFSPAPTASKKKRRRNNKRDSIIPAPEHACDAEPSSPAPAQADVATPPQSPSPHTSPQEPTQSEPKLSRRQRKRRNEQARREAMKTQEQPALPATLAEQRPFPIYQPVAINTQLTHAGAAEDGEAAGARRQRKREKKDRRAAEAAELEEQERRQRKAERKARKREERDEEERRLRKAEKRERKARKRAERAARQGGGGEKSAAGKGRERSMSVEL